VTVAILDQGVPMAYGVVSDISENGTCVQTNIVPKRQSFDVTLSFYNGEYLRASGRIVWSRSGVTVVARWCRWNLACIAAMTVV